MTRTRADDDPRGRHRDLLVPDTPQRMVAFRILTFLAMGSKPPSVVLSAADHAEALAELFGRGIIDHTTAIEYLESIVNG